MELDRKAINTALAKAIAYHQCHKQKERDEWAKKLIELLEAQSILRRD
jgi:hypothetical protein